MFLHRQLQSLQQNDFRPEMVFIAVPLPLRHDLQLDYLSNPAEANLQLIACQPFRQVWRFHWGN